MTVKKDQASNIIQNDYTEIISWDKKYTIGIGLIDSQHMELISMINQLHHACLSGGERVNETFRDAMKKMVDYVRFHFSAELLLLQRINYPDYLNHKKQHDSLVRDILDAAKDYGEGKKFVPHHFARTLRDWVLGHIAVYDKAYSLFVLDQKKKGLLTDQQISG